MPKTKISEFSATPGNNTDIDGINIAEGCAPSGINDAIRELMAQLKDFQAGTAGDSFNGPVGTTTAAAGAFTTLSASSTVSGAGFSTYLASPPAIGGTAAAAGSFTTLTTSSTVTHNGGTANGVAYLNGSKVLTTGSALTFDGSNLGVGLTPSAWGINYRVVEFDQGTSASGFIGDANNQFMVGRNAYHNGTNWIYYASSTPALLYQQSGAGEHLWYNAPSGTVGNTITFTQRMTLDVNGNLGIGTTSPAAKLDVLGSSSDQIRVRTAGTEFYRFGRNSSTGFLDFYGSQTGYQGYTFGGVDGTWATINSSGNLGLGVTPTNNTLGKTLQVGQAGAWVAESGTNRWWLGNNWYYNSGDKYINNGFATLYSQQNGTHQWFNAPSGTAGNAITFTQAMTLDASGNLGVGTTSPTQRLHVYVSAGGSWGGFADSVTTSSTPNLFGSDGTGAASIYTPAANPIKFYTNATERARITSGGSLLVGTTTSGGEIARFQTSGNTSIGVIATNTGASYLNFGDTDDANVGFVGYDHASNFMNFRINGTERARITSGGAFCAGTTSVVSVAGLNGAHSLRTDTNSNWATSFAHGGTTPYGLGLLYVNAAPNGTGNEFLYCYDSAPALRMSVRSNGGIANYSANDVNLSDRREKTNFAPAKSYLDTICAIPVQTFNYIDQSEDDPGLTLGVVAQDVQAVAPELVMESNWGTKEDPKMRLSIYQTDLQYALMKCIQEQQVMINELKAKVAALEAK